MKNKLIILFFVLSTPFIQSMDKIKEFFNDSYEFLVEKPAEKLSKRFPKIGPIKTLEPLVFEKNDKIYDKKGNQVFEFVCTDKNYKNNEYEISSLDNPSLIQYLDNIKYGDLFLIAENIYYKDNAEVDIENKRLRVNSDKIYIKSKPRVIKFNGKSYISKFKDRSYSVTCIATKNNLKNEEWHFHNFPNKNAKAIVISGYLGVGALVSLLTYKGGKTLINHLALCKTHQLIKSGKSSEEINKDQKLKSLFNDYTNYINSGLLIATDKLSDPIAVGMLNKLATQILSKKSFIQKIKLILSKN